MNHLFLVLMPYGSCFPRHSAAAIPQGLQDREIISLMKQPFAVRQMELKKLSTPAHSRFATLAFEAQQPMTVRWNAIMAMVTVGKSHAIPTLMDAAKADVWYMRSAALVGLRQLDKSSAAKLAQQFLSDKSLLVRSTAVTTISQLQESTLTPDLWNSLEDKNNFRHGKGLFIRRQITEALASLAISGDEPRFIKLLEDADPQVQTAALAGLQRLTGHSLGTDDQSIPEKKALWTAWWKSR